MSCDRDQEFAIEVTGLTKEFRLFDRQVHRIAELLSFGRREYHRAFTALDNVSFRVGKGEAVGIIGRNGSGNRRFFR